MNSILGAYYAIRIARTYRNSYSGFEILGVSDPSALVSATRRSRTRFPLGLSMDGEPDGEPPVEKRLPNRGRSSLSRELRA